MNPEKKHARSVAKIEKPGTARGFWTFENVIGEA